MLILWFVSRNMPTGGSVDVKAGKDKFSLKVDGVKDDGTRFVREETSKEWNDDDVDEGSDDVEYA